MKNQKRTSPKKGIVLLVRNLLSFLVLGGAGAVGAKVVIGLYGEAFSGKTQAGVVLLMMSALLAAPAALLLFGSRRSDNLG